MPTVEVAIAWAVPVKPDLLGSHLQAFCVTLPVIRTLRLCRRFGLGPKAFIAKLPVELLDEIEEHVVQDRRRKTLPEWSQKFECYQGICKASDHEDDGRYRDKLGRGEHERWAHKWYKRLSWADGYFPKHDRLMRKHFGLSVWVSDTQLKQKKDTEDGLPKATTTTYLTLPGYNEFNKAYALHADLHGRDWHLESGYGVPITLGPTPTEKSLSRFHRAMRILGLEPFEGPGTSKAPLVAYSDGSGDSQQASSEASDGGGEQGSESDGGEGDVVEDGQSSEAAEAVRGALVVHPRLTLLVVTDVEGGEDAYTGP